MFDELQDVVGESSRASKYLDALTKDERALVEDFAVWLQLGPAGLKPQSASSYKSNLARAVHKSRANEELTSDERVAAKRWVEYTQALAEIIVDGDKTTK